MIHWRYPAVAQPGRAFGCRSWLNWLIVIISLSGLHAIETELSQAQTK